jgi:signal transduction histidine kinase
MSSRATPTGAAVDVLAEWRALLQPLMASTPEPLPQSLGRIAASTEAILLSPYALISAVDEDGALEFFGSDSADPAAADALRLLASQDGLSDRVLGRSELVRLPGSNGLEFDLLNQQSAFASVLGIPIGYEGRTVGALYIGRAPDEQPFTSGEERIAELIAGAAAAVLRRTRLTEDFRWQQRWLTESAQLTRTVLSGEHGEPLRLIVARVREMTRADVVAVVRQRADDQGYEVVEAIGAIDSYLEGLVVDVRAAVLAPLTGPALERGALALFPRATGRAFTSAETEATSMLAEQMSVALDLAHSRTDRERLSLLDERDRIARDLHDHVIQRLFAIGLTVQSVAGPLGGDAADRLLSGVDDLDATIEQIRSTIYRLRGPVLPSPRTIPTKVADLVQEMEPVLGFAALLDIRGPVEFGVDDEVGDDCIAVLREALTNVARHAEATSVQVSLSVDGSMLTLEVTDDGRGIGRAERRSGLANLRARAERRQGAMSVVSGDRGGTRLTWSIPIGAPDRAPTTSQRAAASSEGG